MVRKLYRFKLVEKTKIKKIKLEIETERQS